MSAIRCPPDIENYHIFLKGQYENTFINMSAGCPAATKIENISDKRTTLMEYWMPKFGFKFQLYKLYGEKPQAGKCRVCRFFATLRMTIHCFLWAPLRMTIHCFLRTAPGMTMKCSEWQWKCPESLKETGHYETGSAMQYGSCRNQRFRDRTKNQRQLRNQWFRN